MKINANYSSKKNRDSRDSLDHYQNFTIDFIVLSELMKSLQLPPIICMFFSIEYAETRRIDKFLFIFEKDLPCIMRYFRHNAQENGYMACSIRLMWENQIVVLEYRIPI